MSEHNVNYTKIKYFKKCKELDLLPLKTRLDFFSILLFHKIIHKTVFIKLPNYIRLVPPTTLRSSQKDPLMFESTIKPRFTKKNIKKPHKKITHNLKSKNKLTKKNIKLKSKNNSKSKKVVTNPIKKKSKPFKSFKKRIKNERIYVDDEPNKSNKNDVEEFIDNKIFSSSYFYRTHIQWNNLPLEIRIIEDYDKFKIELECHLWHVLLNSHDMSNIDRLNGLGSSDLSSEEFSD